MFTSSLAVKSPIYMLTNDCLLCWYTCNSIVMIIPVNVNKFWLKISKFEIRKLDKAVRIGWRTRIMITFLKILTLFFSWQQGQSRKKVHWLRYYYSRPHKPSSSRENHGHIWNLTRMLFLNSRFLLLWQQGSVWINIRRHYKIWDVVNPSSARENSKLDISAINNMKTTYR